jgi:hypothetical protein
MHIARTKIRLNKFVLAEVMAWVYGKNILLAANNIPGNPAKSHL